MELSRPSMYMKTIKAYEKDDYESYTQLVDAMSFDKKYLFMVLLESCCQSAQSDRCSKYFIDKYACNLSKQELLLCAFCNLDYLKAIFEKNNEVYHYAIPMEKSCKSCKKAKTAHRSTRDDIVKRMKATDRDRFQNLNSSVCQNMIDFKGTPEDFDLIECWLEEITYFMAKPLI